MAKLEEVSQLFAHTNPAYAASDAAGGGVAGGPPPELTVEDILSSTEPGLLHCSATKGNSDDIELAELVVPDPTAIDDRIYSAAPVRTKQSKAMIDNDVTTSSA